MKTQKVWKFSKWNSKDVWVDFRSSFSVGQQTLSHGGDLVDSTELKFNVNEKLWIYRLLWFTNPVVRYIELLTFGTKKLCSKSNSLVVYPDFHNLWKITILRLPCQSEETLNISTSVRYPQVGKRLWDQEVWYLKLKFNKYSVSCDSHSQMSDSLCFWL